MRLPGVDEPDSGEENRGSVPTYHPAQRRGARRRRRGSRPDAPAYTRATFVIEDRVPGLNLTHDRPPAAARTAAPGVDQGRQTVEAETVRP